MGAIIVSWLGVGVEIFSCILRYFFTTKIVLHDVHDDALPYKTICLKLPWLYILIRVAQHVKVQEGFKHQCCTLIDSYKCKTMVDHLCPITHARDVVNASGHDFFFQKIFMQKNIFWGRFFFVKFHQKKNEKISSKKNYVFGKVFPKKNEGEKNLLGRFPQFFFHLKHSISFYIGM